MQWSQQLNIKVKPRKQVDASTTGTTEPSTTWCLCNTTSAAEATTSAAASTEATTSATGASAAGASAAESTESTTEVTATTTVAEATTSAAASTESTTEATTSAAEATTSAAEATSSATGPSAAGASAAESTESTTEVTATTTVAEATTSAAEGTESTTEVTASAAEATTSATDGTESTTGVPQSTTGVLESATPIWCHCGSTSEPSASTTEDETTYTVRFCITHIDGMSATFVDAYMDNTSDEYKNLSSRVVNAFSGENMMEICPTDEALPNTVEFSNGSAITVSFEVRSSVCNKIDLADSLACVFLEVRIKLYDVYINDTLIIANALCPTTTPNSATTDQHLLIKRAGTMYLSRNTLQVVCAAVVVLCAVQYVFAVQGMRL
ncbi:platelet binding protein GspB-like [Patiria miniata]|uniref:Uncharacterized protein n=1 Tax=Patiria miniata TaxID=46514 RepID=A0A913Z233_PATMI|nr:platelet binding protein GspB-like [Patiria miniata]